MKLNYLLGATHNNELVFGEFMVTHRNGYAEFVASFFTVKPFNGENYDLEEHFENWKDGMDDAYLYNLCKKFDCSPSELAENLANECEDVRDALDCSLYPECYQVDGESWYFESRSCGQYDSREEIEEIINLEAYNILHELWDSYHLEEVDDKVISKVKELHKMLTEINEKEWIIDYIHRHMDDFE